MTGGVLVRGAASEEEFMAVLLAVQVLLARAANEAPDAPATDDAGRPQWQQPPWEQAQRNQGCGWAARSGTVLAHLAHCAAVASVPVR